MLRRTPFSLPSNVMSIANKSASRHNGMMDFEKRLQQAIQRGQTESNAKDQARVERTLGEVELRKIHADLRLQFSEHIEECLRKLVDHFPGFEFSSIVGEEGWGALITREDLGLGANRSPQPKNYYSRFYSKLQLLIRPFASAHIVELVGKGTIRNKEVFSRTQYQRLPDVDSTVMIQTIDQWVLEYAEKYAAQ